MNEPTQAVPAPAAAPAPAPTPAPASAPASPFAAPAAAPAPTAAAPAPTSPFAAPATTAAVPPAGAPAAQGDTSFLDNLSAMEPLVKPCTAPGVIAALALKQASNDNPYVSITVQLYGDKMVYEDGSPVSPGKRLTSSIFAATSSEDYLRLTGSELKGLILALHDIPLDKNADAAYQALPVTEKPTGPARTPAGFVFNLGCLEPTDKWTGTKVMVAVKVRKNKQTGEARNEFSLLAASTKPVERKGKA